MGEAQKYRKDYIPFVVGLTNRLISDLFRVNNTIREDAGKAPLTETPLVKTLSDQIPFEYETISNMMVYGLAWWLLFQDEENVKANAMNAIYEGNKQRYTRARYRAAESVV